MQGRNNAERKSGSGEKANSCERVSFTASIWKILTLLYFPFKGMRKYLYKQIFHLFLDGFPIFHPDCAKFYPST